MKKIIRGINTLIILVAAAATMYGQINLSGKKIHELPALPSNVVDTNYLFIIANPIDGKPYKFKKSTLLSGATGVVDGNYGDVTVSGVTWSINASSVQNSKMAAMANNTFKGNLSGSTAVPQDLTVGQMQSSLGINTKLNATDTASLSNRINSKMTASDTAYLSNRINNKQDLDADLTSISGASGTNTIYYRSAANTWSPVTIGGNMTFSSGTLNSTAGGGGTWGSITGTIGNQTDLAYELSQKQAQLVSASNIKTINNISILGSGNISVGGGGSQTLDQTLEVGSITDTGIVFQDTTLTGNVGYTFLTVKPLTTEPLQSDLQFVRSKTAQAGSAYNEVFAFGFNTTPVSGEPSLFESWESFYSPGSELTSRVVEKHEMFTTYNTAGGWNAGETIRLSSYTIYGTTNSIDLYHTVDAYSIRNKLGDYMSISSNSSNGSTQFGIYSSDNTGGLKITTNGADNIAYISASLNSSNSELAFTDWEDVYFNLPQVRFANKITASEVYSTAGTYLNIGESHVNLVRGGATNTMRLNFAYNATNSANYFYIDGDGGSGEWKFYAQGGGFFPTFYSNGSEAMRLSTNRNMLIGTTTDDNSALLNVTSTTKGVLLPRMTKTQRDAISSPATGLVIYQTDNTPGLRCYNGTNWMRYSETAD